jgi:hypothetical protein
MGVFDQSIEDNLEDATRASLLELGMEQSTAEAIAPWLSILPQFIPLVGAGVGVDNTVRAAKEGNYGEAAFEGAMTLLGEIPVFGDVAGKAIRGGADRLGIFAGAGSDTANRAAREAAEEVEMGALGSPEGRAEMQRQASAPHGQEWFTGADGKMRYEISDHDAVFYDIDDETIKDLALKTARHGDEPAGRVELGLLEDVLSHDDLFDAYPGVGKSKVIAADFGATAGFSPETGNLYLNPSKLAGEEDAMESLLHEVQHSIQQREGFSQGSNMDRATSAPGDWATANYDEVAEAGRRKYDSAMEDLVGYSGAERVLKYRHYAENPPRPGEIGKHSMWYEHGDDIVREFGVMPKKPGPARDEWQKNAWTYLANKAAFDVSNRGSNASRAIGESLLDAGDLKSAKNAVRRAERKLDKHRGESIKADNFDKKSNKIRNMTKRQRYEHAGGEVEARAVQHRLRLTPEQRSARPIWEDYKVTRVEPDGFPTFDQELVQWKDIIDL